MVQSSYIHTLKGRLRINVSCLKGNKSRATTLEQDLRGLEGVRQVTANPMTGNVLIEYDSARLKHGYLVDWLCEHRYLAPMNGRVRHMEPQSGSPAFGMAQTLLWSAMETVFQRALVALI